MNRIPFIAVIVLTFCSGCATIFGPPEPYEAAYRESKASFKAVDYDRARQQMAQAIALAPSEKKPKLETTFKKRLLSYAWREYKDEHWDTSFELINAARENADAKFLESTQDEFEKISQEYAQYHTTNARRALDVPDLARALKELEFAGKAQNEIGRCAGAEFKKWTTVRTDLESKLAQAEAAIDKEEWQTGETLITNVLPQDSSLRPKCQQLRSLLIERHYEAAVRDGEALLAKNELMPAFNKANEAEALHTSRAEARALKARIQKAFSASVKQGIQEALTNDLRPRLSDYAKQFQAYELSSHATDLRDEIADRNAADQKVAVAQKDINANAHERAIPHLKEAKALWPENKVIAELLTQTCLHVANAALDQGRKALQEDCPLVAMVYCLKARTICPDSPVIRQAVETVCKDAVPKVDQNSMQVRYLIDIGFDEDVDAVLDTRKLAQAISARLPLASRFVNVISSSDEPPEKGRLLVLDIDVEDFTVDTQKNMFQKSVRYVSYIAHDPNPEYAQVQAKLLAAQHAMVAAQNDYQEALNLQNQALNNARMQGASAPGFLKAINALGAVGGSIGMETAKSRASEANNDYEAAAREMKNTPPTIPRKVYADYQYIVEEYRRSGLLKVVVRLVGPGNRALAQKLITDTYHKSDQTHDGFQTAGLRADPLDLDTEDEVEARFTRKVFTEAQDAAASFISGYWTDTMQSALRERKTWERWESRLRLALQVPSLSRQALEEIAKAEPNLPADVPGTLDSILKTK